MFSVEHFPVRLRYAKFRIIYIMLYTFSSYSHIIFAVCLTFRPIFVIHYSLVFTHYLLHIIYYSLLSWNGWSKNLYLEDYDKICLYTALHPTFGLCQIKFEQAWWELQCFPYDTVIMIRTVVWTYVTYYLFIIYVFIYFRTYSQLREVVIIHP